jgi:hypothetical protein
VTPGSATCLRARSGRPQPGQYRRYTMPQSQEITDSATDPERARYNAYLRSLDEQ